MPSLSKLFRTVFLCTVPLLTVPCFAQEAPSASEEELMERALELRRELDEILSRLSPEARAEWERRLASPAEELDDEPRPASPAPQLPTAKVPPSRVPPQQAPPSPLPPATPPGTVSNPAPTSTPMPRGARCNTLQPLDSNGDGIIAPTDRYWRHLYLWTDKNGDGQQGGEQRGNDEVESLYERGIRQVDATLRSFAGVKRSFGEIRVDGGRILFDVKGDGFQGADARRRDDALLLLDVDSLARGNGPQVLDAEDRPVSGLVPFATGWRIRDAEGVVTPLTCP